MEAWIESPNVLSPSYELYLFATKKSVQVDIVRVPKVQGSISVDCLREWLIRTNNQMHKAFMALLEMLSLLVDWECQARPPVTA